MLISKYTPGKAEDRRERRCSAFMTNPIMKAAIQGEADAETESPAEIAGMERHTLKEMSSVAMRAPTMV